MQKGPRSLERSPWMVFTHRHLFECQTGNCVRHSLSAGHIAEHNQFSASMVEW
jgi:hypothetical protein